MQAAVVVGWILPSSTSLIRESLIAINTAILQKMAPVLRKEASRLKASLILPASPHSPTLLVPDLFPSLLTPQTGHHIRAVSSATAALQ